MRTKNILTKILNLNSYDALVRKFKGYIVNFLNQYKKKVLSHKHHEKKALIHEHI